MKIGEIKYNEIPLKNKIKSQCLILLGKRVNASLHY